MAAGDISVNSGFINLTGSSVDSSTTKPTDTYLNLGSINFTGSSASLSIATGTTIAITGDIGMSQLDSQASAAAATHSAPFTIIVQRDANLVALGTIGQGLEIRIADGGSITYKDHVYNEGTYRVVGDNLLAADPAEISVDSLGALVPEPTAD
jgi:hypothetical protein